MECNITAPRINNDDAHHLGNICGYCASCNCDVSNKKTHDAKICP